MKILTIIGARPQFVKAAVVSKEISKNKNLEEIIVHTGQHFDENMSKIFFEEMHIPKPNYNLNINSLSHGAMTGRMIEEIEKICIKEKPDYLLVYGDTNSTIAGALAGKKQHIKIAHIEAGLRSFNMQMPEEINRILTDRISDILFCPTEQAVKNLNQEGFAKFKYAKIIKTGDVMLDAAMLYKNSAKKPIELENFNDKFILLTLHREENITNKENLKSIFSALEEISKEIDIVLPLHPNTKNRIKEYNINLENTKIRIITPASYLEMIYLLKNCSLVMTDSGGLQKEAYFFEKYCITLREQTEWIELVENKYNFIAGTDKNKIVNLYNQLKNSNLEVKHKLYGEANSSEIIVNNLF